MSTQEKTITLFTTRVRQLMLRFEEYKKANEELRAKLNERRRKPDRRMPAEQNLSSDAGETQARSERGACDALRRRVGEIEPQCVRSAMRHARRQGVKEKG